MNKYFFEITHRNGRVQTISSNDINELLAKHSQSLRKGRCIGFNVGGIYQTADQRFIKK